MKIWKLMSYLALMACSFAVDAQQCDIDLMTLFVPQSEEVPEMVQEQVLNKIGMAVKQQGVAATNNFTQFFISAKIHTLYNEILPGPPANVALTILLTLNIGDYVGEKSFASTSLELKGTGTNETRAYLNAIRGLNGNNPQIARFIASGKTKIIDYYNTNYKRLLAHAERCVSLKKYEEALYYASSIPECCTGYREASQSTIRIYNQYINYACTQLVQQARHAWMVNPDVTGAEEVAGYLNRIDPDAACYGEAQALYREVKAKVKEDWTFEMRKKYTDSVSITKQKIEAARAVGVAFGNGQKPTTTNLMWLR